MRLSSAAPSRKARTRCSWAPPGPTQPLHWGTGPVPVPLSHMGMGISINVTEAVSELMQEEEEEEVPAQCELWPHCHHAHASFSAPPAHSTLSLNTSKAASHFQDLETLDQE